MQTWLITGGTGLLGAQCVRQATAAGIHVVATHQTHEPLSVPGVTWRRVNLEQEAAVAALIDDVKPSVILHTAAMAQPADCERDKPRATVINALSPSWIASGCERVGARLIHLSTDLVFDGQAGPYAEDDVVKPISHYGLTKVQAEAAVRQLQNHAIVRTSLIMGPSPNGNRGVEELLHAQLTKGQSPRLYVDEFRSPVASEDLARVLVALAVHPFIGTLHVTGVEVFSRYALGALVALSFGFGVRQLTADTLQNAAHVVPPRAPNTSLDARRLQRLVPALPEIRSVAVVLAGHPWARPNAAVDAGRGA